MIARRTLLCGRPVVGVSRRSVLVGATMSGFATAVEVLAQGAARTPRIGILNPGPPLGSPGNAPPRVFPAFMDGLRDHGWVDGRNVLVERRDAAWQFDRLPALADDLVRLGVDVMVVMGPAPMAAARAASGTVPIVMVASSYDPVADGFVASLARPGGNVTGLTFAVSLDLLAKQLQLLQEIVPRLKRVDWIWDGPPEHYRARLAPMVDTAGRQLGLQVTPVFARTPTELESVVRAPSGAPDALFLAMAGVAYARRGDVARIAQQTRRPTLASFRELPEAGGLMSYGPDLRDLYRRAAGYVDRILRGSRPAELPVENPTKFELVVNLQTAKTLGLTVPQSLLLQADEVFR